MSRRSITFHAAISLVVVTSLYATEPQGRLVIKVSDAETGQPIAGARVHANFGIIVAEEDVTFPQERLTDRNGRYEWPVPWGNIRLTPPIMPAGYWPVTEKAMGINQSQQFVVTRQKPVVEKHFTARKGAVWPIKIIAATGTPLPDIETLVYRNSDNSKSALVTDAAGKGQLTLPVDGGKLSTSFFHRRLTVAPRQHSMVEIDPGFNPLAIAGQSSIPGGKKVELIDQQGRKALWEDCSVAINDGTAELVFVADNPSSATGTGEFAGTVVDHQRLPIPAAYVRCYAPGIDLLQSLAKTDEHGGFSFRGLSKTRGGNEALSIHLIVKKEGYAGIVSNHFFVPNADGLHRLDSPLVLQPGRSLPIQVIDDRDQPVEGAWIETVGPAYGLYKSDEWGRCLVRNLPEGSLSFRVSYGEQRADATAEITAASATPPPVVVRLTPAPAQQPTGPAHPTIPKVGDQAPEWTIREWTDGQQHTLASLRGRIVVVDFWSLGCTPCRQVTLPVENELRRKFASDVTFIHLHHAGTEPLLLKELLAVQHWDLLVGVDAGASPFDSETFSRYGVTGYPTEVIIDRQGLIVYHSGEGRDNKEKSAAVMQATAEAIGLPWPIEKDADQDEIVRRLRRFHEYFLTKEIEKALKK
jgi:thiol-disulfide isomerase/thioredoxin